MEDRLLQRYRTLQAWINRPLLGQTPDTAQALFSPYSRLLDKLSRDLPKSFQPKLEEVCQGLSLLFRPEYSTVLHHDDLLEMNIHVDEDTGRIAGIVDWADALVSPFGMSLSGLETVLGVQTSSCWHYHPSHEYLLAQFWVAFYKAVGDLSYSDRRATEIAMLFGLLRTYGLGRRAEKDGAAPLEEEDHGFVCLEEFCLR